MGRHTTTTMALNMFMNDAFPVFGRRLDFERAFAETEQRRSDFLSKMEVDPASNGAAQCYSYSSSTFRSGDNAPVTQSSEEYRVAGGTTVSRTRRSVGDQSVEETMKNGETTRTLHNLTEDELAQLEAKVAEHTTRHPNMLKAAPSTSPEAELPAALQQDLARLKQ